MTREFWDGIFFMTRLERSVLPSGALPTRDQNPWSGPAPGSLILLLCVLILAGCSSMPSSGPTASTVRKGASAPNASGIAYRLVPLNADAVKSAAEPTSVGLLQLAAMADSRNFARTDAIHIGDRLAISIYEVGVSLFKSAQPTTPDPTRPPSAGVQTIAALVREDGSITLPYIGELNVSGSYPEVVARTIRQRLRPLSESPEVLVEIADSVENTAYISGAVVRPGRLRLTSARERLLDALALAGGSPVDVNELQLTLVRGNKTVVVPLNQIAIGDPANLVIYPGDRISLERVRKTFTVFGASDRNNQIPFDARTVTLAEAVSRAGGPSDARANPKGVFLLRLERNEKGEPIPTVYEWDMRKPETYFLAQMFPMRDKDTILIANSASNATQKLANMVNLLFNPLLTLRYVTN